MSIFGDIGNWFEGNPTSGANNYLNQVPGMLNGQYDPYINAGLGALPTLQQQYAQLMNGNFINNMGQNFQQSPGYSFQVNQATNAANRAAAAGGSLGTPAEQQGLAGTVTGLANQDYYNWLNHAMGAYGMGLQGEQGLYNTGFQASNDLAQGLQSNLNSQANLSYAGQMDQNQTGAGILGTALGYMFSPGYGTSFGQGGQGFGSMGGSGQGFQAGGNGGVYDPSTYGGDSFMSGGGMGQGGMGGGSSGSDLGWLSSIASWL